MVSTAAEAGKRLSSFGHALAGAGGAVVALSLTYPLDMYVIPNIKTRLQVQTKDSAFTTNYTSIQDALSQIIRREGIAGLYSGLASGLIGVASTNFAYFYWYSFIRGSYLKLLKRQAAERQLSGGALAIALRIGTFMELVLGALAAALAQVFTIPVAVITTRQQTQIVEKRKPTKDLDIKDSSVKSQTLPTLYERRLTMLETMRLIIKEDGWTGLWRGLKPSLVLCVNPAITYGLFERMKSALYQDTVATVVTYPYIMAKVRMQWKPADYEMNKHVQYKSAVEVLHRVYRSDGFSGLYKGMKAQILKAVLSQALLFVLKDKLTLYTYTLFVILFQRNRKIK